MAPLHMVESAGSAEERAISVKAHVLSVIAILLSTFGVGSLRVRAQNQPDALPEEYKVYEAALDLMDHIPKRDPHVSIFSVTLNSKCGAEAAPAPLANGCTFLWIKPSIPADGGRLFSLPHR